MRDIKLTFVVVRGRLEFRKRQDLETAREREQVPLFLVRIDLFSMVFYKCLETVLGKHVDNVEGFQKSYAGSIMILTSEKYLVWLFKIGRTYCALAPKYWHRAPREHVTHE